MIEKLISKSSADPLIAKSRLGDDELAKLGLAKKSGGYGGPDYFDRGGRPVASPRDPVTGALSSIFIQSGSVSLIAAKD